MDSSRWLFVHFSAGISSPHLSRKGSNPRHYPRHFIPGLSLPIFLLLTHLFAFSPSALDSFARDSLALDTEWPTGICRPQAAGFPRAIPLSLIYMGRPKHHPRIFFSPFSSLIPHLPWIPCRGFQNCIRRKYPSRAAGLSFFSGNLLPFSCRGGKNPRNHPRHTTLPDLLPLPSLFFFLFLFLPGSFPVSGEEYTHCW